MLEINLDLEQYILNHTTAEDPILKELDRETHLKIMRPRMLSGHLQGKFLKMICQMIQPKRVLEIGTYTGYSAISMAMGLPPQGIIHTIDINDEIEQFTRSYMERSGVNNKINFHIGEAIEIIPDIDETFDLVFIDADKRQYIDYYEAAIPKVRSGGFILADDVLWDGKVTQEANPNDRQTLGIQAFNNHVHQDSRVENIIIPIRHGLMTLRKK